MLKIKISDLDHSQSNELAISKEDIEKGVRLCIQKVADQQSIKLPNIESHHRIVEDLGFSSLDIATLTAILEEEFHVDPFSTDAASITEIRSVNDICLLYARCLNLLPAQVVDETKNEFEEARLKRRKVSGGR